VEYTTLDGAYELLPGLRLLPAPGHSRGLQVVVIETGGRPVVIGGDVAVSHGELDAPSTEGQSIVRALDPELVWLAHEHEPWRPRTVWGITPALSERSTVGGVGTRCPVGRARRLRASARESTASRPRAAERRVRS